MVEKFQILPKIGDLLKLYNVRAINQLSQNFILNETVLKSLASVLDDSIDDQLIIEIGPGPGSLTRPLLEKVCKADNSQLVVIEKDSRFLPFLEQLSDAYKINVDPSTSENQGILDCSHKTSSFKKECFDKLGPTNEKLSVVFGDALEEWSIFEKMLMRICQNPTMSRRSVLKMTDAERLQGIKDRFKKIHIIGNLPYNISTPLLILWLRLMSDSKESILSHPKVNLSLMFQEEVAMRMIAPKGTKEYGRLCVATKFITEPKIFSILDSSNFVPVPKVTSAFVNFKKLDSPFLGGKVSFNDLNSVITFAFNQRQKILCSRIKSDTNIDADALFSRARIDPSARAIDISLEEYVNLTKEIRDSSPYFFLRGNPVKTDSKRAAKRK